MLINQLVCEGGGRIGSESLLGEGPGFYLIKCTSPIFHVLTGTGKMAMQKLSMVRIACDTNEAVEEIIDVFDKHCCSKASVVHEYYKHVYCS
jgi:hypothetical protein